MWRAVLGCVCTVAVLLTGVLVTGVVPAAGVPGDRPSWTAPGGVTGAASVAAAADPRAAPQARVPRPADARPSAPPAVRTPARPGVVHRELTVGPGGPTADLLDVDLTAPGVRIGLLTAGDVAGRAPVSSMAERAGGSAAVNGDFFDLGRSGAPAGPQVRDGRLLSSAVPDGRRRAPAVPRATADAVLAVGTDGRARIDRLRFGGTVSAGGRTVPVLGLNQYAVPVGGVGLFTPDWGDADRARTLCGSDTDRDAPCSPDVVEVAVRDGRVTAVRPPGAGRLAPGETALLGRDEGAAALRALRPGEPVTIRQRPSPLSGAPAETAVGGSPILVGGRPPGPLDDRARAPRTAAGIADGGRRLLLVTVDGRETADAGVTLAGLAGFLTSLGARDAVNLDGGGSSTMVHRGAVVNTPAEDATRLVPNALGVFG